MADKRIKAGFGAGEIIFPAELFPVEGFTGVHDSPYARLMVLESEGVKIAIAALEMVNVPPRGIELCQSVIEEKTGTPRDRIWIHVTHAITTMHEPGPMGPPEHRPPMTERDKYQQKLFFDAIETAITEAAKQAAETFGAARIGWGTGLCEVNVNRDIETPFGWWTRLNPEGPSNKTMTVLRVEDLDGKLKGLWVSYGLKPCAIDMSGMKEQNRQVSADVSGAACVAAEEKLGVPVLFCCSAAGDQVPREQSFLDVVDSEGRLDHDDRGVEAGIEIVGHLGAEMAQAILGIAEDIECKVGEALIQHQAVSFQWPGKDGRPRRPRGPAPRPESYPIEGEHTVEVEIITLGDAAFVAEKPEVNCQTELELWAASPYVHTCMICMVNGGFKYMPDRLAYERYTFEAQNSALQPGAAEKFVEVVAEALNRLHEAL